LKVSIITVVYNNAKTIDNAIKSVLAQTYPNIEYIIIDGASTDGTLDIIEGYKDSIDQIVSEPDKGLYSAMNKGLNLATGDVIGFINSDDQIFDETCVASIVQEFDKTGADVVYGNKLFVSPQDIDKTVRYWKAGPFRRKNFEKGWMSPHLSTYIRKTLYDKYGHFREDFKIAADYELMLRFMFKEKSKVAYLDKTLVRMMAGGISNSSLKNILISNLEVYRSWKVNDLSVSPVIIVRKPLNKIKQLFKRNP
jgi:glycosyltransferase involved in cell wall biosynthesis